MFMKYKELILVLFVSIFVGCNTVKIKNKKLNGGNIEFQYEKNGSLRNGYNSLSGKDGSFELIFLYRFNDSVFIYNDTAEIFADKIITNEITDNPNVIPLLKAEDYNNKLLNIKIPNKNINEYFYLTSKYKYLYMFYYEDRFIIRYSNKMYDIY